MRILEGLGLHLEGRRPGYRLRDGRRHTELVFGRIVEELPGNFRDEAERAGLVGEG